MAEQNRKTESFIVANDTVFFWVGNHFGCGESWLYRSQAGNHEYDEEGRLTKPTRGNGRGPVRK